MSRWRQGHNFPEMARRLAVLLEGRDHAGPHHGRLATARSAHDGQEPRLMTGFVGLAQQPRDEFMDQRFTPEIELGISFVEITQAFKGRRTRLGGLRGLAGVWSKG